MLEEDRVNLKVPFESYYVDFRLANFDIDAAWLYLNNEAYWARYRSRDFFEMQARNAFLIAGLFHRSEGKNVMVGMVRVAGDGDTNVLNDVYILKEHQGSGLGVVFLRTVLDGQERDNWRWLLYTGDRKEWYVNKFGFSVVGEAARGAVAGISISILERDGRTINALKGGKNAGLVGIVVDSAKKE